MHDKTVDFILENIGGVANVKSVSHCMTRLRFLLKDKKKVDINKLSSSDEIMTVQFVNEQLQIVVGTHVEEVYNVLRNRLYTPIVEEEEVPEKTGFGQKLIDVVTKTITPVLGILVASGLLKGILAILVATNVLTDTDGAYIVLDSMGEAVFFFFPIFLGVSSAETFGLNKYIGMLLGAILTFPGLEQALGDSDLLYTVFTGTVFEVPVTNTFFGLPIMFPPGGYVYSVLPIILITFFASRIARKFDEIIPESLALNINDFLVVLITIPVALIVIGPVTTILSQLLAVGVESLYSFSPILATIVVSLIYQPLVVFGLHWGLSAIGLSNLAANGMDYIFPMSFTATFAQTAVVVAVYFRTRSDKMKGLAVPAIVSGLFNIIEPAIYGFSLPDKKRFAFSMVGGMTGALILTLTESKMFAFSWGVLGMGAFIDPSTSSLTGLMWVVIASLVSFLVTFFLTYFTYKPAINEL